jgi:hypothetical protein
LIKTGNLAINFLTIFDGFAKSPKHLLSLHGKEPGGEGQSGRYFRGKGSKTLYETISWRERDVGTRVTQNGKRDIAVRTIDR